MVLETRIILLFIVSATFMTSCTQAPSGILTDRAAIFDMELELLSLDNGCTLQVTDGNTKEQLNLQPKPPCYFSRRESTSPQIFEYPDVGVQATLLVVGTPLNKEDRLNWGVAEDDYCGRSIQGLLVQNDELVVSRKPVLQGVLCRDKGADEKDFWYFAH